MTSCDRGNNYKRHVQQLTYFAQGNMTKTLERIYYVTYVFKKISLTKTSLVWDARL